MANSSSVFAIGNALEGPMFTHRWESLPSQPTTMPTQWTTASTAGGIPEPVALCGGGPPSPWTPGHQPPLHWASERSIEDQLRDPSRGTHCSGAPRTSTGNATSPLARSTEGFVRAPTDLLDQMCAAPSVPASSDAPMASPGLEPAFPVGPPQETARAGAPSRKADPPGIE
eukprot:jgi/Botrbrau1/3663/Bobra.0204s0053.1